jgi:hypothetical protein
MLAADYDNRKSAKAKESAAPAAAPEKKTAAKGKK